MDEHQGVSDKVLEKAQKELADFLAKNHLPKYAKMMLEMQSYLLLVMVQDHKRVGEMYPVFKAQRKAAEKLDRLKWIAIPVFLAMFTTWVWQAIYFVVDSLLKIRELL